MIRLPDINLGIRKIKKDCSVQRHQLVAFAFTRNGHIIGIDTNRRGSGEISNFSLHAEEFLVNKLLRIKARERYGQIFILVTRLGRKRGWTMAKPCPGCQWKLREAGVNEVYYTNESGQIVKL
jgi:hypothetical protein